MKGKPITPPVHLSATYQFENSSELIDVVENHEGYIYSRWDNPTVVAVEKDMSALEGYTHCLGFASGMAAITTALMAHVQAGSRVIAMREIYGATFEFLNDVLPGLGVKPVFFNCWETDRILQEIDQGVDLLYLETPTNPLLRVVDVKRLADAAHQQGAVVMLDSTFASPINQRPVELGVDVVLHSATKYIGGHHDITAGFACFGQSAYQRIWNLRKVLGGIMDPMTAFLVKRSLATLELRVQRQNDNAMVIAEFLEGHPNISATHYPGLASHPDHDIAERQMTAFGGMVSFEIDGDFDTTKTFMDQLQVIKLATSLGGITSLANQPITNTHVALSPENRNKAGISPSLVRLSAGLEPTDALIGDLEQALATVS
ncbi:MAG: aminotransferase class I/II-fold pyridoxal phosphate-dependent enzyme [Pseudomonadota bacterium]